MQAIIVTVTCPCGKRFEMAAGRYVDRIRRSKTRQLYCSRLCGYKYTDSRRRLDHLIHNGYIPAVSEPDSFRKLYDSLPDDAKDTLMYLLGKALLWRGWTDLRPDHGAEHRYINDIATVLADNGHEIPEYT